MAEFTYHNPINANIGYTTFELNYLYYPYVFFRKDINPHSQSKIIDKWSAKLREQIIVCLKNFYSVQKLQKQVHTKGIKARNYIFDDKIWLNSKYIRVKKKQKLEAKFFRRFQIL